MPAPGTAPASPAITIEREAPIPALALTLWMQALAEHAGARLLRLKGLVALAEAPERPAVLHAIQHVVHPLEWLDALALAPTAAAASC